MVWMQKLMEEQLSMISSLINEWMEVYLERSSWGAGRQFGENQEICFEHVEFEMTTENPAEDIKSAAGQPLKPRQRSEPAI